MVEERELRRLHTLLLSEQGQRYVCCPVSSSTPLFPTFPALYSLMDSAVYAKRLG
jgi:hypothetical protein